MAGMSFAADLPVSGPYRPGPFVVRQPVEWTGLYFGANAGYGWGKYSSNITFSGASTSGLTNPITGITPQGTLGAVAGPTELSGTRVPGSGSPSGAIVGGQIGFNWQAGMFVFGGEIDGQWSGQENTFSTVCGTGCSATESIKIRSLATGRGRLGLAFDWFMPYVTGGAAMVNGLNNLTMTVGGTTASFAPLSHTTLGWTAGAGVEVALWSNWSAKLEYLYVSANGATKLAPIPGVLGLGFAQRPATIETISFVSASTTGSAPVAAPACSSRRFRRATPLRGTAISCRTCNLRPTGRTYRSRRPAEQKVWTILRPGRSLPRMSQLRPRRQRAKRHRSREKPPSRGKRLHGKSPPPQTRRSS